MTTLTFDAATVEAAVAKARTAAAQAALDYIAQNGESYYCGFAWTNLPDIKLNTKLGRALAAQGFKKSYYKGVDLWNPSGNFTQSMDVKEAGAYAFVKVLEAELPGIRAEVGTRAD